MNDSKTLQIFDSNYEILLKNLLDKVQNYQMTEYEYRYISSYLLNKNFLVFGTGYDSMLWEYANRYGHTCFLEHDTTWIPERIRKFYIIQYTCSIGESDKLLDEYNNKNFNNLKIDLPEQVTNLSWDAILVDGPPGYSHEHHGRMQSIFTARQLSNESTNIFVHDCDRKIEKKYTESMFSKTIFQTNKFRHVQI